jgi:1-acyl-sn-glycerol-3-phosphate acyltransferase
MLARRTGAAVVPAGVIGTHKVLLKGQSRLKRHRIVIAFGEPFRYSDIQANNEKEAREQFARELQRRIVDLCERNGLALKISPSSPRLEVSDSAETQA